MALSLENWQTVNALWQKKKIIKKIGDLKERLGKGRGSPAVVAIFLLLSALLCSADTQ